ncbi:hypothetical protein OF83DRAFT_775544 [Amylostereum chailletii]|nr:hypothetical protein OF83DRAFT_775544 [Amylostereum chailletii]
MYISCATCSRSEPVGNLSAYDFCPTAGKSMPKGPPSRSKLALQLLAKATIGHDAGYMIGSTISNSKPDMDKCMHECELDANGRCIPDDFQCKHSVPRTLKPQPPVNGSSPPLLFYGFPFKKDYLSHYARRHELKHL